MKKKKRKNCNNKKNWIDDKEDGLEKLVYCISGHQHNCSVGVIEVQKAENPLEMDLHVGLSAQTPGSS